MYMRFCYFYVREEENECMIYPQNLILFINLVWFCQKTSKMNYTGRKI